MILLLNTAIIITFKAKRCPTFLENRPQEEALIHTNVYALRPKVSLQNPAAQKAPVSLELSG